jgi:glutaredoxin 2
MGLGFLNLPYESIVLPYNDESTPIQLTGVKMLPILEKNEVFQNESLEILKSLDTKNVLKWEQQESRAQEIDQLLQKIGEPVHSLCMPYWVWTPEFDDQSRHYFQSKKEVKRGPFKKLIQNKGPFLLDLNLILNNDIESNLTPFYKSSTLSIIDIMIAAHLWGMYIFPEFQFTTKMHHYLQSIKEQTQFDYHKDFFQDLKK